MKREVCVLARSQVFQSHRPSTPQRAHACSFPPCLLPESWPGSAHSHRSGRFRHLPASRPSSRCKPHRRKATIPPQAEAYAYLQQRKAPLLSPARSAENKRATCRLHPGTNAPQPRQGRPAPRVRAGSPGLCWLGVRNRLARARSEAQDRQSSRADAAQPEL